MKWLHPCVNDQTALTSPMLVHRCTGNAVNIGCRVAAGEDRPEEVVQAARDEIRIVHNYNQRELVDCRIFVEEATELVHQSATAG